ncbi:hypothetical protein CHS0354_016614 [Potamilus streckersoni]|uniref:BOD1/SHG1 domain-containing protein n=1 Tax=Potamilus streckersoni TaxID=2493646 RepID=A0AAE0THI1_9BIVA|nr:hypothetical protein CHS0354_016614 [Potamilus streckersoni]
MNPGTTPATQEENIVVNVIINKLKSQGLFDQFRKECLVDVDTKPAYKNLRQRVETYVTNILGQQKWSPDLNKNQVRESLRRQLNNSSMLTNGVERIIEQVVNPKIMQVIKPKIDEIVCQHLGIDPKQRQEQLRKKQLSQQQQSGGGIMSLMSLSFSSPPGNSGQLTSPLASTSNSTGSFSPNFQSGGPIQPQSTALVPLPPVFPQMGLGFSQPPPFGTQQNYPFMQGWAGGFPPMNMYQQHQLAASLPDMTRPPPTIGLGNFPGGPPPPIPGLPGSFGNPLSQPPPGMDMSAEPPPPGTQPLNISNNVTPQLSNLVAVSVPTVSPTHMKLPSVPGSANVDISAVVPQTQNPSSISIESNANSKTLPLKKIADTLSDNSNDSKMNSFLKEKEDNDSKNLMPEEMKVDPEGASLEEIPLPPTVWAEGSDFLLVKNEDYREEIVEEDLKPKHSYKFAWHDDNDDPTDSDVSSISSIHTSDLSDLEESSLSSFTDKDEKEEETAEEKKEEEKEAEEIPPEDVPMEVDTCGEECEIKQELEETLELANTSLIEQPSPVKLTQPVTKKTNMPPKPRKLISLQYNYSDSEGEETREERKARIVRLKKLAREKEDRYLRRLQRRADIEARRKEREEEKSRQREERRRKKEEDKTSQEDEKNSSDKNEGDDKMETPQKESAEPNVNEEAKVTTEITEKPDADGDSAKKIPSKKRKTKEELKAELREQKQEQKIALRRQRTRNRRFVQDEFTPIFKKVSTPQQSQTYEETVIMEETVEIDTSFSQTIDISTEQITVEEIPLPEESYTEDPTTPTQDEPSLHLESPDTPTQDEHPIEQLEGETSMTAEGGIPIVELPLGSMPSLSLVLTDGDSSQSASNHSSLSSGFLEDGRDYMAKRKRKDSTTAEEVMQSEEPIVKRVSARSTDGGSSDQDSKNRLSKQDFDSDDLYKPRLLASYSQTKATSPSLLTAAISHSSPAVPPLPVESHVLVETLFTVEPPPPNDPPPLPPPNIVPSPPPLPPQTRVDSPPPLPMSPPPLPPNSSTGSPPPLPVSPPPLPSSQQSVCMDADGQVEDADSEVANVMAHAGRSHSDELFSGRVKSAVSISSDSSRSRRSNSELRSRSTESRRARSRRTRSTSSSLSSHRRCSYHSDSDSRSRSHSSSRASTPQSYFHSKSRSRSRSPSKLSDLSDKSDDDRRSKREKTPIDKVNFGEAALRAQRNMINVNFGEAERRARKQWMVQRRGNSVRNWQGRTPPRHMGEPDPMMGMMGNPHPMSPGKRFYPPEGPGYLNRPISPPVIEDSPISMRMRGSSPPLDTSPLGVRRRSPPILLEASPVGVRTRHSSPPLLVRESSPVSIRSRRISPPRELLEPSPVQMRTRRQHQISPPPLTSPMVRSRRGSQYRDSSPPPLSLLTRGGRGPRPPSPPQIRGQSPPPMIRRGRVHGPPSPVDHSPPPRRRSLSERELSPPTLPAGTSPISEEEGEELGDLSPPRRGSMEQLSSPSFPREPSPPVLRGPRGQKPPSPLPQKTRQRKKSPPLVRPPSPAPVRETRSRARPPSPPGMRLRRDSNAQQPAKRGRR